MFSSSTSPNLKQLENKSAYNLADVILVRRRIKDRRSEITGCWVGELPSGRGMLVPPMSPLAWKRGELPFAAERKRAAEQSYGKRLNVDPLLSLAFQFPPDSDPIQGGRDEWRLVARIDDMLPGAVASPDASQTAGSTVVLAHLAYGPPRPPAPDANSPSDVMPEGRRNAFDEELGGPPPEL
jgi:hypothetical protein